MNWFNPYHNLLTESQRLDEMLIRTNAKLKYEKRRQYRCDLVESTE